MAKRRKSPASPTDTPAFKAWFGNSVVVDEAGAPLVCFHGTKRGGFSTFDKGAIDKHHAGFFFTSDGDMAASYAGNITPAHDPVPPFGFAGLSESGMSFERQVAAYNAAILRKRAISVGIYQVYLRIENPLVVDAKGASWAAIPFNYNMGRIKEEDLPKTVAELTQFLKSPQNDFEYHADTSGDGVNDRLSLHLRVKGVREEDDDGNPYVVQQYTLRWHNRDTNDFSYVDDDRNPWWYTDPAELLAVAREAIYNGGRTDGSSTDAICDEALARGHDGCIIKNVQDYGGGGDGRSGDVYVVFDPNQVKSASVNNGNYSRTDNDIRHNPSSHQDDPAHVPDASGWLSISECSTECAPALHRNPAARRPAHVRGEGAHTDAKALTAAVASVIDRFNRSPAAMSIPAESPLFFEGLPPAVVKFTAGRANAVGVCLYNMRTGACVIQLHGGVWEDFTEDERLETVLHETAHAIDFQRFAHRNSKHGARWQFIAKALGGKAQVTTDEAEAAKMNAWRRRKQGLPPAISTESIEQLGLTFDVGQFVTFPFKRKVLTGCVVGRVAPTHAKVRVYEDGVDAGLSISVPYDHLTRVKAPKVPGVDKPFPGESLSAWQERTGKSRR